MDRRVFLPFACVFLVLPRAAFPVNLGGTPLGAGTTCYGDPCGPVLARKASWGSVKAVYR